MTCRNSFTDLFYFSPRDMARIERPFTHEAIASSGDMDVVRGLITMTFDGVFYGSHIEVTRKDLCLAKDARVAYGEAVEMACRDIYRRLPLLYRPGWHWHEHDRSVSL